ncbi:PTS mannose transporter subunit IIA [Secundilactobacillus paracollinoides]|uniref:PTS mannose transporter subunit IIA n=1 Tax=Secundilactobacillus paracollinoides TaxID=240427 RepID=A0A1B2IZF4_9LACO|nr:PTS sugar transporter subunit IIA [Secundilactobacillus paracollinoides]ANZ61514.1 PTS mannose transporter subunit IIA [Secundilactobacillus paracollinoides]ANZ64097.1 PTS mannose transporter subunit IIA [Secundilactobacillus paracollinoides]ANZ67435.1 PTS mannose transporter subunit IIA [Secundilactobacillus paracollinoides]KRL78577.1 mannose PTS, EIIA [Secundilactobacillus paracollinoides DSM 15502 = JCM 11969]
MIAMIVASHGDFASGILQSATMIFGAQTKVTAVTFQASEGPADLKQKYEQALAEFDADDQVLFLVDLWGGTPFNVASQLVAQSPERMALLTGLNLPMMIDAYTLREQPLTDVVPHLENSGRKGIRHLDLTPSDEEDDLL